jgi:hypothetical protein
MPRTELPRRSTSKAAPSRRSSTCAQASAPDSGPVRSGDPPENRRCREDNHGPCRAWSVHCQRRIARTSVGACVAPGVHQARPMSSPIAPDTAAREAATRAGARLAVTTLLLLAVLAAPAAAQDTQDGSPSSQNAAASQGNAATVT